MVNLSASLAAISALGVTSNHSALLQSALSSGFLMRLTKPITAPALAMKSGLGVVQTEHACAALLALGILTTNERDEYFVTPLYSPLLNEGADKFALARLDAFAAKQQVLQDVFTKSWEGGYWKLDGEIRRRIAEGVTVDPTTEFARQMMQASVAAVPEMDKAFSDGARYLEFGCGVAGALLTYLQIYPSIQAVGVDIAADLVEHARRHASALNLSHRAEFHTGDASSYSDPGAFDVVFWSQFFFTTSSRNSTLINAFSRLRPGGLLVAPVLQLPVAGTPPDAKEALDELFYASWGVPIKSPEDVVAEMESAGFEDASVISSPLAVVVTARRP